MPIIEVNAELGAATTQLKRIADCLVEILRTQGIHMEPVKADMSMIKDTAEIDYATDEATLKQTLVDIHEGKNPFRPVDIDEP